MKLCIEKTEDGQFMVGEMAEGPDLQADEEGHYDMQPAESLDAALEMARALLGDDPNGEMDAAEDAQLAAGFKSAGGDSIMSSRGM